MTPGSPHSDAPSAQPLRSDAERNRERIIAAARTVFARDGLNASMASVAREAGVGIATMFRRFPTKEELVDAVFSDRMQAYADAVTAAMDDPDPWKGFVGYIEAACAMQAADNGFADVLTMTFPTAKALERLRHDGFHGCGARISRDGHQVPFQRPVVPLPGGRKADGADVSLPTILHRRPGSNVLACSDKLLAV